MIEPFWIEIAKQIPNLIVLAFLVLAFIKHLNEEGDRRERMEKDRAALFKEIKASCHGFQTDLADKTGTALDRNTTALERNSEALGWSSRRLSNNGGT